MDAAPADRAALEEEAIMLSAGEIAAALGGATHNGGGWLTCCCCHEDKRPSLSLRDGDDGKLLVRCFAGCDPRDVLAELRQRGLLPSRRDAGEITHCANPRPAPKPARRDRGDLVPRLWRESVDPRGTLAEQYLCGRGLALDDGLCGRTLRFHGRCPFGKDDADKAVYVPALIVAFRPFRDDDENRAPRALHRIGLDQDGNKLGKMMLGPVGGCAVKLDADENVEQALGTCEGLETGLAIRATGWKRVWCLGSAGAIKTFAPIPGIETITIFADHDEIDFKGKRPGQDAARECAQAWQAAGCEVFIRTPHSVGADWLDAS
jgi:putative DNA primase/helicase